MITVQEHTSKKYPPRTYFNATSSDVTLALAVDLNTAGEMLTKKAAGDKYIGFQLNSDTSSLEVARQLYKFMKSRNAKKLNIAGNGIYTLSEHGCDQEYINYFVHDVISKVNTYWPIEKIFTGGQTGVDLAGAVAARNLDIEALITLPNGYIQRFEDKKDIEQTQQDVINQIEHWNNVLSKNNNKSLKP